MLDPMPIYMGEKFKGGRGIPKEEAVWDGEEADFLAFSDNGPGVKRCLKHDLKHGWKRLIAWSHS